MIVTCERCTTQFELDDARVPEDGVRVRCSRCKHAFLVEPPGFTSADRIHREASRALASAGVPGVTRDLSEDPGIDDEESDWSFDDELDEDDSGAGAESRSESLERRDTPALPASATRTAEDVGRESEAHPAFRGSEIDADELGSPVDWDLQGGKQPLAARSEPKVSEAPRGSAAPAAAAARVAASRAPEAIRSVLAGEDRGADGKRGVWLRRAGAALGWLATAALCCFGLFRGLAVSQPVAARAEAPVAGVEVQELRGRWIDNASLGSVYVVSGRLHNTTGSALLLPPLALVLRDSAGRTVGEPLPVGAPRALPLLREGSAEELRAGAEISGALPAGAAQAFEGVAWPLPDAAEHFEIRAAPTPSGTE